MTSEREIEVADWDTFELKLEEIRQSHRLKGTFRPLLFRGHGDSDWKLETTLERRGKREMPFDDYYRVINRIKPQIEAFTKAEWEIMDYSEVTKLVADYDKFSLALRGGNFPAYAYMIYLRHHGFPSPLLDWTRSPFIAAYFAFRSEKEPSSGKVSIYIFSDTPENSKGYSNGTLFIHRLGPYVRSHPRHFVQQADYTICLIDEPWRFGNHEDVTDNSDSRQDRLWKFIIPWTERKKVLRMLADYNLNAFSLFASEEALMETMALLELDKPEL